MNNSGSQKLQEIDIIFLKLKQNIKRNWLIKLEIYFKYTVANWDITNYTLIIFILNQELKSSVFIIKFIKYGKLEAPN